MKIFLPPLEIGDEEGFAPEKDLFDRKDFGDGLTRLITNVDDPLVIAIDGQWGSGKTTFLKMWAGELRKQDFPVVFFDAFANDYMNDAFVAIAGQIIALAENKKKSDSPKIKKFVSTAKRVGKVFVRSTLKIGLKAATLGALDDHELESATKEAIKDVAKEASDLEDKYIGELLTKQTQEKDAIEQFKLSLEQLSESFADETLSGEKDSQKKKKPLVFIIDELDRCRPDFALSLLERIKHFFSVPNVYFILGVHSGQLENSVRAFYGQDIDSHNYLQKFIHFTFPIRSDEDHRHIREYVGNYVRGIFKAHEFPSMRFITELQYLLISLVLRDILSLRAVERIASTCALVLAFEDNHKIWHDEYFQNPVLGQSVASHLIIMKTIDRSLYQKAVEGTLAHPEFMSIFKQSAPDLSQEERDFGALWYYLIIGKDMDGYNYNKKTSGQDGKKMIAECKNLIVERSGWY